MMNGISHLLVYVQIYIFLKLVQLWPEKLALMHPKRCNLYKNRQLCYQGKVLCSFFLSFPRENFHKITNPQHRGYQIYRGYLLKCLGFSLFITFGVAFIYRIASFGNRWTLIMLLKYINDRLWNINRGQLVHNSNFTGASLNITFIGRIVLKSCSILCVDFCLNVATLHIGSTLHYLFSENISHLLQNAFSLCCYSYSITIFFWRLKDVIWPLIQMDFESSISFSSGGQYKCSAFFFYYRSINSQRNCCCTSIIKNSSLHPLSHLAC